MKTILFPTDFTTTSEQFFGLVCLIARAQSAEIIVLHVIDAINCPEADRDGDQLDCDSLHFQSCWERFSDLRACAPDLPISFQARIGPVVRTIANVAVKEGCDLIAMTMPAPDEVCHQFYRNISGALMQLCPCPILTLRNPPLRQFKRVLKDLRSKGAAGLDGEPPRSFLGPLNPALQGTPS